MKVNTIIRHDGKKCAMCKYASNALHYSTEGRTMHICYVQGVKDEDIEWVFGDSWCLCFVARKVKK